MEVLKSENPKHLGALLGLAKKYLDKDYQVLGEVPASKQQAFTECVKYLRDKAWKTNSKEEVEQEPWTPDQKSVVLEALSGSDLQGVDTQWRIDVALTTNSLSKVLRPEIFLKLSDGTKSTQFHMNAEQFQELRRQTAALMKDMFALDQLAFIQNLKN